MLYQPHIGGEVNLLISYLPVRKEMMWCIYEISHIWAAVVDESEEWSSQYIFLKQLERRSLKKKSKSTQCVWLVEHRTGIAEVTGSNPVEALIFFRLLLSNCLNWKIWLRWSFFTCNAVVMLLKMAYQSLREVSAASSKYIKWKIVVLLSTFSPSITNGHGVSVLNSRERVLVVSSH